MGARRRVQDLHPGTADRPRPPDQSTLAALRERIAAASGDHESIRRLADSLSPGELRAVVSGMVLEAWEDLRKVSGVIIGHRASPRLLGTLWDAWQRYPQMEDLRRLLFDFGDDFGWKGAVGEPYASDAHTWVEEPGRGTQRWLEDQGLSFSDLPELVGTPIRPDSPLARLIRVAVMTHGSRPQLRQEAGLLPAWERELDPEEAILFGQNYLSSVPPSEWNRTLLDRIRQRYGPPLRPEFPRFWQPLSEEVKKEFQRLYIRSRIREELRHDGDREQFWARWADEGEIVDLTRKRAGRVQYAEFDFETFAVFEFFETGNAAYFYFPDDAERIGSRDASTPSELKEKKSTGRYGFVRRDNRIIHNPPGRWYARADQAVRNWLRATRGRKR